MLATLMVPTRRPDLVSRTLDDEVVILDRASGQVHRLNATASSIWRHCDGTAAAEEIAARVAAEFDEAPPHLLDEVIATIAEFARLGLLTRDVE
jgi:PqqD family protein of HPr-rel-A system